jgi:NAD(P)-dependent dehydrogenase (short-subunit alcohol dehydrogenase family)
MQLQNRVALVTGAASGIGLAIAAAFIAEGAKVLLADVETAKGEAAAADLGAAAAFIRCDVGDKASVTAAVAEAVQRFGRLDCLVNNAGIIHTADFLDLAEADFDRVLRVNLKGGLPRRASRSPADGGPECRRCRRGPAGAGRDDYQPQLRQWHYGDP